MKFAGYDAVFFTGISEEPVYLFINNGKAELRDATHLWGKDTYQTEDILKSELGKDEKSLGLIEIRDSPIRWVNVLDIVRGKGTQSEAEAVVHRNVYVVPNSSVSSKGGYMLAKSVRVKSTPLIGRVVDIRWEGGKSHGNLMRRMSDDVLLNQSLIRLKEDVTIRGFPEYNCWAILSSRSSVGGFLGGFFGHPAPSRKQWDCYETIARHLLEHSGK
ncbi:hypothetical protein ES703_78740 [subsurface metagenome]